MHLIVSKFKKVFLEEYFSRMKSVNDCGKLHLGDEMVANYVVTHDYYHLNKNYLFL